MTELREHPAKYSEGVLVRAKHHPAWVQLHPTYPIRILDPFAGVGGIHHAFPEEHVQTVGVELEPEWASHHPRTLIGNALHLPFPAQTFDAIVTSPCYGNRMADTYDGRDGSRRHTYRIALGRMPSDASSATMQWGHRYRIFHTWALGEMERVLKVGGLAFVNMSDHYRAGQRQFVVAWWMNTMRNMGFDVIEVLKVSTPRMRHGANHNLRVDGERVIVARRTRKGSHNG